MIARLRDTPRPKPMIVSTVGALMRRARRLPLRALGVAVLALGACSVPDFGGDSSDEAFPQDRKRYDTSRPGRPPTGTDRNSLFGPDGLSLFGGGGDSNGGVGIGVNSYLWRASLDTISFMPLSSADPFGGVVITDWYTPPGSPEERFKVNLFILGQQLRADGVRVAVFRQRRTVDGGWLDAPVESKTATDLENAILARARQLRINSAPQ
jgi:hypothetical protein